MHANLRRALNVAVRWQLIHSNPAALVEPPSLPHVEVRPYSLAEARRFLKAVEGLRLEARWLIGIALGLRQGEVLGLRWDDIDLAAGTLRVRGQLQRDPETGGLVFVETKTARSRRTLPLPPTVLTALLRHQQRQAAERFDADNWADPGLVFATSVGTPIHPRNDYRSFRKIIQRAGLRQVRLHDLRHTAASVLLAQGVPARVVMEILGHSQISVTLNIYAHVAPEIAREAASRLEGALWSGE
ncbi:site-specific integrase [Micromonospora sp. AP08]|uniref:tyrosine-type recombinase/integrase n=1 Tax=Micromonospora sp. AP08 TaxID=2604467 RepID=UPI0011D93726|nr:site-specific integrase [Micromonospora sp. AP08]TYB37693.1 site-specific integrase [Micromonospora sp. AP08]